MPLVSRIGRRSPRSIALLGGMVLLLTLGAVGMLVPFLLMVSGSSKTGLDQYEHRIIPEFLGDDTVLYRKYVEALFNESLDLMRSTYGVTNSFETLPFPAVEDEALLGDWQAWLQEADPALHRSGFLFAPSSRGIPEQLRRYRATARESVGGNLADFNRKWSLQLPGWRAFVVLPVDRRSRKGLAGDPAWLMDLEREHPELAPAWMRIPMLAESLYREIYADRLPASAPEDPVDRADWEHFVRVQLHPRFLQIAVSSEVKIAWTNFLQAQFGSVKALRRVHARDYPDWTACQLSPQWAKGATDGQRSSWLRFLEGWQGPDGFHQLPLDAIRVHLHPDWGNGERIRLAHAAQFQEHRSTILRVFLFQNIRGVWDVLVMQGRGLSNTVIYCAAAILLALIVNPMAAYALSRFRPRHTYSLLLVMLLTMAFPPMVTQIPVFLMLRDFGLLNTFWALLLPGMAHGYSIFLLKGFFDSLPRELYESASLDGAGEWCMFRIITLSLSKPILAVIALSAFVSAYTNFMFALLICQDEKMWTLMVWLYQLQQQHGPGVMNASFLIAAIPTLLVFLFCQNLIMRGIVIPSEK